MEEVRYDDQQMVRKAWQPLEEFTRCHQYDREEEMVVKEISDK